MDAYATHDLLRATAQGLLTLDPRDSHRAIAGLIHLVERVAERDNADHLEMDSLRLDGGPAPFRGRPVPDAR